MAELRVLVVDDEPLVREGIRVFLEREADVRVLGEARNGEEAVERIRELRPDLVLLDVQMPGMDGLAVVAALEPEERPAIVFVTAHSEYAIRAFDLHAVDYLLKPFDAERFATALRRARARMVGGESGSARGVAGDAPARARLPRTAAAEARRNGRRGAGRRYRLGRGG